MTLRPRIFAVALALAGALAIVLWWLSPDGSRIAGEPAAPSEPATAGSAVRDARAVVAAVTEPPPVSERQIVPSGVARSVEPSATEGPLPTSVSVRFVDPRGAPVSGATLALGRDPARGVRSGAGGDAELRLEPGSAGALDLVARCEGFATERRRVTARAGQRLLLGDWVLADGGAVEGRVVDPAGAGLAGVAVACLDPELPEEEWGLSSRSGLGALARPGASVETAPDGSFRLEGVPAGTRRIVAVAEDRPAARSEPVEVPAGGLALGAVIRMEEADGGTTIAGVVLDPEGLPLAGARVRIEGGGVMNELGADGEGRFRKQMGNTKPCSVTALDRERRWREAVARHVRPGTTDLVLRLAHAPEIVLVVRDARGSPIERFGVALVPAQDGQPLVERREDARPGGTLLLPAPAQDFRVVVRANGWLPARLGPFPADVPPAELACVLEPAGGVAGVVEDDGRPVAGAWLALFEAVARNDTYNGFPLRMQLVAVHETESDADGRFALSVERAGRYYLWAEAFDNAPAELGPLALDPAARQEVRVELGRGGALEVRVRSAEGASVAGRLVAISRGDGGARTERTDEAGAVTFTGLVPGRWQVELSEVEIDPDYGATRFGTKPAGEIPSNCSVREGETTRLDLWLEEPAEPCTLLGRLTIDGAPAEGWLAGLESAPAEMRPFQEPGAFRIGHDEPGPQRLLLRTDTDDASAMLVLLDDVELVLGEVHWSLELATGALEGTLSVAEGTEVFHRWTRGPLELWAPVVPGADGRFRCARVPAGRGALAEVDPARALRDQTPAVLAEVTVEAGRTTTVER